MYDYITDADKGKVIAVSIPLTDFKMSNPNRINRIWSYSWDSKATQEVAEADLQYFNFIGLMRDCNPNNVQPASSGNIYISDMKVCDVKAAKNLEVRDVSLADRLFSRYAVIEALTFGKEETQWNRKHPAF